MKKRIRSTHVHDNDGKNDSHLLPLVTEGGTIDWKKTMELLRSGGDQYPLVLELKERPELPQLAGCRRAGLRPTGSTVDETTAMIQPDRYVRSLLKRSPGETRYCPGLGEDPPRQQERPLHSAQ